MSETNKAVALDFIEAMSSINIELGERSLAPDAFAVAKGFGKFGGVRHRDVMIGTLDAFRKMVPTGLRLQVHTVTAEGDRVVVECEGNAVTSQGKPYCNQYCFVFTFADGKIRQVNEYFCNVLANEVLWPLIEDQAELQATAE